MAYKRNMSQETKDVKIETKVDDKEKEQLKQEIEVMKKQMEDLMRIVKDTTNAKETLKTETIYKPSEKYVTFINLTNSTFVLKGSSNYELKEQFSKRSFTEHEARIIVNNMQNAIQQGYVYIVNADFVKSCDLEDVYSTLLTDTQLKDLLKHDAKYVVDIYKNASKGQQKIIVDMIKTKKIDNEKIDANILIEIGSLCGENLMDVEPINSGEG